MWSDINVPDDKGSFKDWWKALTKHIRKHRNENSIKSGYEARDITFHNILYTTIGINCTIGLYTLITGKTIKNMLIIEYGMKITYAK